MTRTGAYLTVGVGFRRQATVNDIIEAIDQCIDDRRFCRDDIRLLATAWFKRSSKVLAETGRRFGVPIEFLEYDQLAKYDADIVTRSQHSKAATGIACISESAALAAAGRGASLIAPRKVIGPVTCAVAIGEAS